MAQTSQLFVHCPNHCHAIPSFRLLENDTFVFRNYVQWIYVREWYELIYW